MSSSDYPVADPTIEAALAAFLSEQEARLSRKSFSKYASVIQLLTHSLNGYAYLGLDKEEERTFEHYYNLEGEAHREFCQIFGPEHIPDNVGEFLGYFLPRKVYPSRELEQAAGTALRKLAGWLHQRGYIDEEQREEMILGTRERW
jgi:hypothetical protein